VLQRRMGSIATLSQQHNSGMSMSVFNTTKHALTPAEEQVVVNYAVEWLIEISP